MSKIFDTLFLGAYSDARNETFLQKNNITHIVTVGVELKPLFPQAFKYLYIPALDTPEFKLNAYFDQIADFIHKAIEQEKGKVFVHCYMGVSRSTTSILAYLIKYHKIPPQKGRTFVQSKRSVVWPNDGFMRQLGEYAKKLGVTDDKFAAKTLANFSGTLPAAKKQEEVKEPEGKSLAKPASEETKTVDVTEYFCKSCGVKAFNSEDIEHDLNNGDGFSVCNTIYLKPLAWIKPSRTSSAKIFCPNSKCNAVLGVLNQNGGKCLCGKRIDEIYAVYPARVASSKMDILESKTF